MARHRRRRRSALGLVLLVVVAAIGAGIYLATRPPALTPAQQRALRLARMARTERRYVARAERLVNVVLPRREGMPAPATPAQLFTRAIGRRVVLGFVPYWALSSFGTTPEAQAELHGSTIVVFSALCVGSSGAVVATPGECENAASALSSAEFSRFVTLAHRAGDRVLLSVETIDPKVIDAIARAPVAHASALWASVAHDVIAGGLDGLNLDIEGRSSQDRRGYAAFVHAVGQRMHNAAPTSELVVDTLPQSGASSSDFFDLRALGRSANALFVMAYQMEQANRSSANSPLADPNLGWSVVQSLMQYTKLVSPRKIILGLPFYGLAFETKSAKPGSALMSATPDTPLYLDIAAAGRPARWDVNSETPYTAYRKGGHWYQDWYDDPVSIALKSALASVFHLGGVGVWAMSMEGNSPEMLHALEGNQPPIKLPLVDTSATAG